MVQGWTFNFWSRHQESTNADLTRRKHWISVVVFELVSLDCLDFSSWEILSIHTYIYIYVYKSVQQSVSIKRIGPTLKNYDWLIDWPNHYIDVIMTTMASQITSLAVVYSSVYLDADQRKHQSSASLAFVWGIHRDRWIPRTKGQLRGECFHLMTWSCDWLTM